MFYLSFKSCLKRILSVSVALKMRERIMDTLIHFNTPQALISCIV